MAQDKVCCRLSMVVLENVEGSGKGTEMRVAGALDPGTLV